MPTLDAVLPYSGAVSMLLENLPPRNTQNVEREIEDTRFSSVAHILSKVATLRLLMVASSWHVSSKDLSHRALCAHITLASSKGARHWFASSHASPQIVGIHVSQV